jgi:hypothetical protein
MDPIYELRGPHAAAPTLPPDRSRTSDVTLVVLATRTRHHHSFGPTTCSVGSLSLLAHTLGVVWPTMRITSHAYHDGHCSGSTIRQNTEIRRWGHGLKTGSFFVIGLCTRAATFVCSARTAAFTPPSVPTASRTPRSYSHVQTKHCVRVCLPAPPLLLFRAALEALPAACVRGLLAAAASAAHVPPRGGHEGPRGQVAWGHTHDHTSAFSAVPPRRHRHVDIAPLVVT